MTYKILPLFQVAVFLEEKPVKPSGVLGATTVKMEE